MHPRATTTKWLDWLDVKHKHHAFYNHALMVQNAEAKRKKHIRMRWLRYDT